MSEANTYQATVINETGLPDDDVIDAVRKKVQPIIAERYLEFASFTGNYPGASFTARQSTPQGLFVRGTYRRPTNVLEEMELAMSLAEEDDDVASTVRMISKTLFQGWKHLHVDDRTVSLFDQIARNLRFNARFREATKALQTIGVCYPVKVFTKQAFPNFKQGQNPVVNAPQLIMLNPLSIRVVDMTGDGQPVLVQEVDDVTHNFLLGIGKGTPGAGAARPSAQQQVKRSDNPIAAALYTQQYVPPTSLNNQSADLALVNGLRQAWYLNPKMVSRWSLEANSANSFYPPVPLKSVFGLCEAKRLLNELDYSLLNGAINFLIVVKKGSDNMPALPEEIANLQGIVQTAARTGVMVGDHRLSVEIISPKLDTLLSAERRNLLGKKIVRSILCLPDTEFGRIEGGGTPEAEIISSNLMGDRSIIVDNLQQDVYDLTVANNAATFTKGVPTLWFPPIQIAGNHFFADAVLKLRDRGDVPRSWGVEVVGLDAQAALAERQREIASGFDKVMTAQNVPSTAQPAVQNGRPTVANGGGTGANSNGNNTNPGGG